MTFILLIFDQNDGGYLPPYQSPQNPFNGIYTDDNTNFPITTNNSYEMYPAGGSYYSQIPFTNIIITSSGDTRLATTLYIGNNDNINMTLYPFINGSNITINGSESSSFSNGYTYTYTFVGAQFPISCTTFTLYFDISSVPSETLTAFNQ